MTAAPAVVDIGVAKPVHTSAYDGALPGSTWEIDPGQTLRVELINDLPPLDHSDHAVEMDRPHEWTTTNLHTHGLHVSPEGDGDNVFVAIEPAIATSTRSRSPMTTLGACSGTTRTATVASPSRSAAGWPGRLSCAASSTVCRRSPLLRNG